MIAPTLTVVLATTKREALAKLAERDDWALFVLDVALPDDERGGLDVLRATTADFPDVTSVVMTGGHRPEISHALCVDFDEHHVRFLEKPLPRGVLEHLATRAERGQREHVPIPRRVSFLARTWRLSTNAERILADLVRLHEREEIARAVGLSVHGVKYHVDEILHVSGFATVRDLVAAVLAEPFVAKTFRR